MLCKKRSWVLTACWIFTVASLIAWIIIFTYYVRKYDVPHLINPSESDLVLDTLNPDDKIIMDVTFTNVTILCNSAYPAIYQKCTTGDNGGDEQCKDMSMCIAYIDTGGYILGSMGLAFEENCDKCSEDMAKQQMAYSVGSSRSRDDAVCFFGCDHVPEQQYLFCLPSFNETYQKYNNIATILLVMIIVFGFVSIMMGIYAIYRVRTEENKDNSIQMSNASATGIA